MRTIAAIVAVAALSLAAPISHAGIMTFNGMILSETVKTHAPGLLADDRSVPAGAASLTYDGLGYVGYCVDLDQYAGSSAVVERSVYDLNNGQLIACLFDTYSASATTGLSAAALGVAIWEVLTEPVGGTFDLTEGRFWITGNTPVRNAARTLLDALPGHYTSPNELIVLSSQGKQDFLIAGVTEVPEPMTLSTLSLGAVLLLFRRQRRTW